MKNMDDYYRQKAIETRPASRDLRTALPNGDNFRSRSYVVHKEAERIRHTPSTLPQEFRDRKTRELPCPTCHARPGAPCISQAKERMGAELTGFHTARSLEAQRAYARKP